MGAKIGDRLRVAREALSVAQLAYQDAVERWGRDSREADGAMDVLSVATGEHARLRGEARRAERAS